MLRVSHAPVQVILISKADAGTNAVSSAKRRCDWSVVSAGVEEGDLLLDDLRDFCQLDAVVADA